MVRTLWQKCGPWAITYTGINFGSPHILIYASIFYFFIYRITYYYLQFQVSQVMMLGRDCFYIFHTVLLKKCPNTASPVLYSYLSCAYLSLQFTKDVVGHLDNIRINLIGIILLEPEGKQNLLDFSEAGLSEINYADYLEEVIQTHSYTQTHMHTNLQRLIRLELWGV